MQVKFIGQGIDSSSKFSVGNQLIRLFANKDMHSFMGITAFSSLSGIRGISIHIDNARKHLKHISIITGIDQKGTSKEALELLSSLNIDSFIFYQLSSSIFHPKIYLFEGEKNSELIIGSSNLTAKGLFVNTEASLLICTDNNIDSDRKVITQLKELFSGLFDFSDPNLKKITQILIDDLVRSKVVPTEAERKEENENSIRVVNEEYEKVISKIFPKRDLPKIPKEFKGIRKPNKKSESKGKKKKTTTSSIADPTILLWKSRALTKRDLNIPTGSNTNPTGSMLLSKGETAGIDQRHYFRDTVFSTLNWDKDKRVDKSHLERAEALFEIIIDGKDCGEYYLDITHNTRTDTRSYLQNNSMTSLSWGIAKEIIAKEALIGKHANLSFREGKTDEFVLTIR